MPRARNLKHDFFMDDELAEHPALARLFFEALWCLADYKGDIEWREKKIKALTLPYDDVDIKEIAINLDKSRFIRFYSDGEKVYLNIRKFSTHQNPHKNERDKGSSIPAYSEKLRQLIDLYTLTINQDKSRLKRNEDGTNPADSLSLIPDSRSLIPDKKKDAKKPASTRFKKPSLQEVENYRQEKNLKMDSEAFIDHFESNGWKVGGKGAMKDWKASMRNWARRNFNGDKNSATEQVPLKNMGDTELMNLAESMRINTQGKDRWALIDSIKAARQ